MNAPATAAREDRRAFTDAQLDGHFAVLTERVFQVETKWPHFRQLLRDARRLAGEAPPHTAVVSLDGRIEQRPVISWSHWASTAVTTPCSFQVPRAPDT